MRSFFLLMPILALPNWVLAQPKKDAPAVPVIKLTVSPAAAPMPALRYELLPNFRERIPGNAALSYHRAILLLTELRPQDPKKAFERDRAIDEMAVGPLEDIKIDKLYEYLPTYRNVLREVEAGALRETCDWDLERQLDTTGIGVLLPEVQKMRELARLLGLRCRLHMAEGKIDEAIQDVRIGFAMARHTGEGSTLIQSLVGMAIHAIFAGHLERILEMPNCPNLYWALTSLPRPFLNIHKALEGEIRMIDGTLPILREIEKGPMTVEQVQNALDRWAVAWQNLGSRDAEMIRSRPLLAAFVAMSLPRARESLLRIGKTEAELNAMPAGQIVLLDAVLRFRSLRDEMFVWFHVPYGEAVVGMKKATEKMMKMRSEGSGDVFGGMLLLILPGIEKVHFASVRTDRKIALHRVIEALRMHAAANRGKFPAKLSDITLVPVPTDPVSGKLFEYELTQDGKALLTGVTPTGQNPHQGDTLKYELTLRK